MIPNNACHLCLTAAAGTELAVTSFGLDQSAEADFLCPDSGLHPEGLPPARGVAGSGFRPLPKIITAAPRGGPGSVSVPMWRANLSVPLPVIALVGHYLTNKLIGDRPLPRR